jgi:carbon monoxide dehydrogenase subunit G
VKVQGTRSFSASRQTVWEVLNDPSRMAKTMPGVESFEVKDDTHWSAKVKIPLGLGGLRMSVSFEKTDERHLEYSRLHAKGNGVGAIMSMDTQFHLADEGAGTKMDWEADVRIAGPVGSMGQRVLQPIVNQQVSQVLTALEREVESGAGAAPAPAQDASAGRGSSGAEEGISPLHEESYSEDPQGPTTGDTPDR